MLLNSLILVLEGIGVQKRKVEKRKKEKNVIF
jgi:hypothetical protein